MITPKVLIYSLLFLITTTANANPTIEQKLDSLDQVLNEMDSMNTELTKQGNEIEALINKQAQAIEDAEAALEQREKFKRYGPYAVIGFVLIGFVLIWVLVRKKNQRLG